jgi:hypothetical protein
VRGLPVVVQVLVVAVQVAFERRQILKPVFHLIGARVETI